MVIKVCEHQWPRQVDGDQTVWTLMWLRQVDGDGEWQGVWLFLQTADQAVPEHQRPRETGKAERRGLHTFLPPDSAGVWGEQLLPTHQAVLRFLCRDSGTGRSEERRSCGLRLLDVELMTRLIYLIRMSNKGFEIVRQVCWDRVHAANVENR